MEKGKIGKRNKMILLLSVCIIMIVGVCISACVIKTRVEDKEAARESMEEKDLKQDTEDEWVDVKLVYLGSAKVSSLDGIDNTWADMPKRTDGNVEYTTAWFNILNEYLDYQIQDQWFGFYDADFDVEATLVKEQRMQYVMVYGRKPLWMQYRTKENMWGTIPTRIGVDWNEELNEYTEYFYKFEYSTIENGVLADMTVEGIN